MEPQEREFVDRMGLVMERFGGTRTMGRAYAWLMICEPPHASLTELATELGVSKTVISTVARQMETGALLERVPTAGREHRYRVVHGGMTQMLRVQLGSVRQGVEAMDLGLAAVDEDRAEQRARLEDARRFFAFLEEDAEGLLRRWQEYRDRPEADDRSAR